MNGGGIASGRKAFPVRHRLTGRIAAKPQEVLVIQALVKYESGMGHVELREVEAPRCGDDQVKIEVSLL